MGTKSSIQIARKYGTDAVDAGYECLHHITHKHSKNDATDTGRQLVGEEMRQDLIALLYDGVTVLRDKDPLRQICGML